MIKRSFFGLKQPKLQYSTTGTSLPEVKIVTPSQTVQLLSRRAFQSSKSVLLMPGDDVKASQKLRIENSSDDYVIATAGGTIRKVETVTGDFGRMHTAISIETGSEDSPDEQFGEVCKEPSIAAVKDFLAMIPGGLPQFLLQESPSVQAIVVTGMDTDLLVTTSQHIVKSRLEDIKSGIKYLKEITGIQKVFFTVPETLGQEAVSTGATVNLIGLTYPAANPKLVVQAISGEAVPAGKSCEEAGYGFITAEAVASIGSAFDTGRIPMDKLITVVDKYGRKTIVSACIGTPIADIFAAVGITVNEMDRIVAGGPMNGSALYTESYPVCPDMDAIYVQDKTEIPQISDCYCINCGECVRACPANIQVNLLVRYLEANQYEDAVDLCDLNSCIECGLCSFVCTSKIPIFQFIRLAKHELSRIQEAEADNA